MRNIPSNEKKVKALRQMSNSEFRKEKSLHQQYQYLGMSLPVCRKINVRGNIVLVDIPICSRKSDLGTAFRAGVELSTPALSAIISILLLFGKVIRFEANFCFVEQISDQSKEQNKIRLQHHVYTWKTAAVTDRASNWCTVCGGVVTATLAHPFPPSAS